MAVSQYLRPGSLLESVQSYLTPGVIHSASSLVGESESSTRQTMNGAVASVLTGVTHMASSQEGAGNLASMVREGGFGSSVDNMGSLFGAGNATTKTLSSGQQLLGKIFGGNATSIAETVGRSGGVRTSSATKLMSLAAPLVMGVLGKRAATQRLDSTGLASLLMSEKSDIAEAAPAGISQFFGRGPTLVSSERLAHEGNLSTPVQLEHFAEHDVVPARNVVTERIPPPPAARTGMKWVPLALAALVALGLLWALRGRSVNNDVGDVASRGVDAAKNGVAAAKNGLEQLTLPGGGNISVAPGTINYDLAKFLGNTSAQGPKTFVFDNLNFDAATTQLTPESQPTVNNMASILKAYPNAQVELVGYTDNTGAPDANQTLSQNRADAVKALLVNQGVSGGRITTRGLGQDHPIASNDTEEGKLKNRRTELTVNNK